MYHSLLGHLCHNRGAKGRSHALNAVPRFVCCQRLAKWLFEHDLFWAVLQTPFNHCQQRVCWTHPILSVFRGTQYIGVRFLSHISPARLYRPDRAEQTLGGNFSYCRSRRCIYNYFLDICKGTHPVIYTLANIRLPIHRQVA